jgi:2-polyprenyl-6-methoxyphenol hydroxylase-like FAD-dependent oxidoreductase
MNEDITKEAMFRNSEWTPENNTKMIKEVYNFPIQQGREGDRKVLGDLIDATDPELISKVFLEAKLFETWYHGRTVLIGDAVHKMPPSAGQGAVNAMEDAVVLANCLYEISDGQRAITPEKITEVFKDYREQRYTHAKYQVENSAGMAKILSGQVKKGV